MNTTQTRGFWYFFLFFLIEPNLLEGQDKVSVNQSIKTDSPTIIRIHVENGVKSEQIRVMFYRHAFDSGFFPEEFFIPQKAADGAFLIQLDNSDAFQYVSVYDGFRGNNDRRFFLHQYLIESGDSVTININVDSSYKGRRTSVPKYYEPGTKLKFSGRGSEKFTCKYVIDKQLFKNRHGEMDPLNSAGSFYSPNYFSLAHSVSDSVLNIYKDHLSKDAFSILKINIYSSIELDRFFWLSIFHPTELFDSSFVEKIIISYNKKIGYKERRFSKDAKLQSINYPKFLVEKLKIEYLIRGSDENNITDVLRAVNEVNQKYIGEFRDKLITLFVLNVYDLCEMQEVVGKLITQVKTSYCLQQLNSLKNQNVAGSAAYNFLLPDTSDKLRSLKEFRGKTVFIDFWFSECTPCAFFYKRVLSNVKDVFKSDTNVVFISISVDENKQKWLKAIILNKFTSPEAINLYTDGKGIEHPVIRNFRVNSFPSPVLIDPLGRIVNAKFDQLRKSSVDELSKFIALAGKALPENN